MTINSENLRFDRWLQAAVITERAAWRGAHHEKRDRDHDKQRRDRDQQPFQNERQRNT